MATSDIALEDYLALIEDGQRNESDQLETVTQRNDDMISADAVKNIVGNLALQMENLTRQMEVAKTDALLMTTNGVITTTAKEETVTELVTVAENVFPIVPKFTIKNPTTSVDEFLPFECSRNTNTISTTTGNIFTTPITTMVYTQTPTTPVTTTYNRLYQTTPLIPLVPQSQSNLSGSQFDLIQQQLSLLTQAVSLLTILINNSQKPKLMEPKIFSYEKEDNLQTFLEYFEEYCQKRYPQSPDQWVRLLEKYLSGKFLRLYTVITKKESEYRIVKEVLLKWYKQEEKKRNENKLRAYHSAKRQTGEDVNLFALRLEQLAGQAFPGVNMREHESLRTAFILSLPTTVQSKLREFIIQNEMCTQTKVPWDKLVLLADSYDRELCTIQNIETTEMRPSSQFVPSRQEVEVIQIDEISPKTTSWSEILKRSPPKRPMYNNTPRKTTPLQNNNDNRVQTGSIQQPKDKNCTYCGRIGHTIEECYKANGICSYCKIKGHIRSDCRNIPRERRVDNIITMRCPYCTGKHLGMNCPSRNRGNHNVADDDSFTAGNRNLEKNQTGNPPRQMTPLPPRNRNNSRNFENSTRTLTNDPWAASGAKPKTNYMTDCTMCGESHVEGNCHGDPGNFPAPQ